MIQYKKKEKMKNYLNNRLETIHRQIHKGVTLI